MLCVVAEGRSQDEEPDAFRSMLARLKESQHMHMIADASEKCSTAAVDLKDR